MPLDKDPLPDAQIALLRRGSIRVRRGLKRRTRRRYRGAAVGASAALGVRRTPPAGSASGPERDVGAHTHRPLRPGAPRERGAPAFARSLEGDADPPRVARPRGPAAHAGGDRRLSRRHARPTPTSAWSIASWRRRITANAGRGRGSISPATPTRNGYEKDRAAHDVEVPRLGDRRAQPRHAVRPVHDRADRRRHAAERDRRPACRHRLPSQHAAQPGGRHRRRGGAVGDARRSRQHDGHRLARDRPSPAPSATTTSTIRSRSATTTGMLAFFDNVEYSVLGKQGGDHWIAEPELDLPTPEQAATRKALASRARRRAEALDRPAGRSTPRSRSGNTRCARPIAPGRRSCPQLRRLARDVDAASPKLGRGARARSDDRDYTRAARKPRCRASPPSVSKRYPIRRCRRAGRAATTTATSSLTGIAVTARRRAPAAKGRGQVRRSTGGRRFGERDLRDLLMKPAEHKGDLPAGWAIDATRDDSRVRRQVVFVPAEPIELRRRRRADDRALVPWTGRGPGLGRFRLSVTSNADPLKVVSISASDARGAGDAREQPQRGQEEGGRRPRTGRGAPRLRRWRQAPRRNEAGDCDWHRLGTRDAGEAVVRAAVHVSARARQLPREGRESLRGRRQRAAADGRRRDAEPAGSRPLARRARRTRSPRA